LIFDLFLALHPEGYADYMKGHGKQPRSLAASSCERKEIHCFIGALCAKLGVRTKEKSKVKRLGRDRCPFAILLPRSPRPLCFPHPTPQGRREKHYYSDYYASEYVQVIRRFVSVNCFAVHHGLNLHASSLPEVESIANPIT